MIFTYLLLSDKAATFYCGISENVDRRLLEHNSGKVHATKSKKPWRLVYKKSHPDYVSARKHEKWLKKKNHDYKKSLAGQAATRYLDILEKEGRIRQEGKTGKYVVYVRV